MDSGISRILTIGLGLAAVALIGFVVLWGFTSNGPYLPPAGLTETKDDAAIGGVVTLSQVGILTSTNFLGHKIYVVRGMLKNVSAVAVRSIDVKMSFVDYSGKTIHEEVHTAFDLNQRPLEPGTDYQFEINFENLPKTWNYRVPKVAVVKVLSENP
jgi:hypothetical protein